LIFYDVRFCIVRLLVVKSEKSVNGRSAMHHRSQQSRHTDHHTSAEMAEIVKIRVLGVGLRLGQSWLALGLNLGLALRVVICGV